ncbi:thiamine pyrophosphate-binding protein [Bordetella bronchiseptica]|uniref:thiamine pyrophosphate-binding protein n=1 Tax=Bordetella bronchiseptica TaxID=518 RepID=UPI00028B5533|nr:thiamine pyrophosphate-binding protein [Bordetella bronchiseptica]KCV32610.1 putative sulfopyruvate decarboxylase, alpha subunit [Bordetella bronchiseptica 00-P-2730]AUL16506.1 decarboxylase [Bordetella bronchiseptica]AWP59733.1 decarboxylase [Bordetella bronchiseptica]AWQ06384.1 decarboxylase [Bordetella bronchiseptica]AZW31966.1 decarboxylase [Bordetella bronchiseptica]
MGAIAAHETGDTAATATWDETVWRILKKEDIRLVTYVPDKVLKPLIDRVEADDHFQVVCPAREEEALGIVCGAQMAGMRSILLTQTSGFATLANVLASLPVPYEIPVVMVISERGALGDRQLVQVRVWQTMRPILDSLGIPHHTLTRADEVEFVAEEAIRQAFATRSPAALILSPKLTKKSSD